MELKELLHQFSKRIVPLSIFFLVAVIIGYIFTSNLQPNYSAEVSLYVDKTPEELSSDIYGYDGYYAQQVAEAYTDTVVGLLEQPDILVEAQKTIEWIDEFTFESLYSSITVMRVAPQVVQLSVTNDNADYASDLVLELSRVAMEQITFLNQKDNQQIRLVLVNESPLVQTHEFSPLIGGVAGGIISLVIGILSVSLITYLKQDE